MRALISLSAAATVLALASAAPAAQRKVGVSDDSYGDDTIRARPSPKRNRIADQRKPFVVDTPAGRERIRMAAMKRTRKAQRIARGFK